MTQCSDTNESINNRTRHRTNIQPSKEIFMDFCRLHGNKWHLRDPKTCFPDS